MNLPLPKLKSAVIVTMMALCFLVSCQKETQHTAAGLDVRIDSVLQLMTLEEKIGQLNLPSAGAFTTGAVESSDIAKKIADGKVGGLFNIKSVGNIREMQKIAVEKSRLKIPLIFGMDVIHGYESVFPIPLGLSCSWDMKLIERSARIAAIAYTLAAAAYLGLLLVPEAGNGGLGGANALFVFSVFAIPAAALTSAWLTPVRHLSAPGPSVTD